MRHKLSALIVFLVLLGLTPLLTGCHATAGAGEDISATGKAMTNSAEKHKP